VVAAPARAGRRRAIAELEGLADVGDVGETSPLTQAGGRSAGGALAQAAGAAIAVAELECRPGASSAAPAIAAAAELVPGRRRTIAGAARPAAYPRAGVIDRALEVAEPWPDGRLEIRKEPHGWG